jgi:hypothetical protein
MAQAVLHGFLLHCIGDGRLCRWLPGPNRRVEIESEQCPNWKGVVQSIGAWFRELLALRRRAGSGR